jgi:hypothetical protein
MYCSRRRQLFSDYLERVQALAVEMELVLKASEEQSATDDGESWFRVERNSQEVKVVLVREQERNNHRVLVEEARIQCDIARLAVESHIVNHGC